MKSRIVVTIIIAVSLFSCSGNRTTADLQKIYGQQFILPQRGEWRISKRDTTVALSADVPKIVAYYNAQGCTSCRLKELLLWGELIDEIRAMPTESDTARVEFVMIFDTGKDLQSITIALQQYGYPLPVICDTNREFEKQNFLPDKEQFHYFLLDGDYRVRLVGSPLNNPRMWQLYKNRIAELNEQQK